MLPEDIPEFRQYPHVYKFVKNHLSMQFGDIRSMLRLPLPNLGIGHACNFAATATICNLISGISVTLFQPEHPKVVHNKKLKWISPGETFKQLLTHFYPWKEDLRKDICSETIYKVFRNPLAHSLGVNRTATRLVKYSRLKLTNKPEQKTGLTQKQIGEIESSSKRPYWLPEGLQERKDESEIIVEGFYRDTLHMLWALAKDKQQMKSAESRFEKGNLVWRK